MQTPDLAPPLHTRCMEMIEEYLRLPSGEPFQVEAEHRADVATLDGFYRGIVVQVSFSDRVFSFIGAEVNHVANGIRQTVVQGVAQDHQDASLQDLANKMLAVARNAAEFGGGQTRH